MNVLIDTQILIWIQEDNAAISALARSVLTSPENQIYVTQVSFFEIAIKLKIGKLPAFQITIDQLMKQTIRDRISIIQLSNQHIAAYDQIPFYADHRNPRSDVGSKLKGHLSHLNARYIVLASG